MGKNRFPLKLAGDTKVRTLGELREHFDLEALLGYYKDGRLLTWLNDRYLEGEAEAVQALDAAAPDFQRRLCEVFQVEYTGNDVDMEAIERRQERLKRLRTIADDAEFIKNIDRVAFDQEELADLLDEGESRIYLCGEKFIVPASRKGITYIGIGNPAVHISGKVPENPEELGIEFRDAFCDNMPQAIVSSQAEQSMAPGGTLDLKLAELLKEESTLYCLAITENYLIFERSFPFSAECRKPEQVRLDLNTLEEELIPESVDTLWNCNGAAVLGDKILALHLNEYFDAKKLDTDYIVDRTVFSFPNIRDVTDKFILMKYGDGAQLLICGSGKIVTLNKPYERIVDDCIYTVEKCNTYRYNPFTDQTEEVEWGTWEFITEKICGDYIYGITRGICSEKNLIVINNATGESTNMLHYWDSRPLMKSSCMYQDHWILVDQHMPHDPITIYSVNLKTAQIQQIAYFESDSGIDLWGIIGGYFYYTNDDKLCKISIAAPEQVIEITQIG